MGLVSDYCQKCGAPVVSASCRQCNPSLTITRPTGREGNTMTGAVYKDSEDIVDCVEKCIRFEREHGSNDRAVAHAIIRDIEYGHIQTSPAKIIIERDALKARVALLENELVQLITVAEKAESAIAEEILKEDERDALRAMVECNKATIAQKDKNRAEIEKERDAAIARAESLKAEIEGHLINGQEDDQRIESLEKERNTMRAALRETTNVVISLCCELDPESIPPSIVDSNRALLGEKDKP